MIDEIAAKKMGAAIRRARKEVGFSQEALAKLIGVSAQTIGKWEAVRQIPKPEAIVKISDAITGKNKKIPLCPGCGMPMRTFGASHSTDGRRIYYIASYSCVCGWYAPIGQGETKEEALKNALKNACLRHG